MTAVKPKFTKGALVRNEASKTESATFIVEVTAKDGDSPRDVIELIFEDAHYGVDSLGGFTISEAVVA